MKALLRIINQNRFFYIINSLLITSFIILLLTSTRTHGFIWLNQFHTNFLTFLFEKITLMGDGWFVIAVAFYILFFSKKHQQLAFIILLSYISSGIFSQLLKTCISSPRPLTYFEMHHYKYYLETFANCRVGFKSFPSGHTASVFAFSTAIGTYFKRKDICLSMIIISVLVGYSRIYLGHHFLIDVTFGAIIGLVFGILSSRWVPQLLSNPLVINKLRKRKKTIVYFPNASLTQ